MPGRCHGWEGDRVPAFRSQRPVRPRGELNQLCKSRICSSDSPCLSCSHSYSVFTYLCRDGSRNYRQCWPLNCRGLNLTLSSVVLRRSTKSWSSHRSSTWTGKNTEYPKTWKENLWLKRHVRMIQAPTWRGVSVIRVCVQISSQKHRTDAREEKRRKETQGAACSTSTGTWMASDP